MRLRSGMLIAALAAGAPAQAADPAHVARLLDTGTCFDCDLTGARLSGAQLAGADLSSSDLTGADLSGADLRNAEFQGANLTRTNLSFADLRYTSMIYVDLTDTILEGARLDQVFIHTDRFSPVVDDATLAPAWICGVRMPDGRMERSGCLAATE